DPAVAADWFTRFEGAGLDGVVVKAGNLTYKSDERVMVKVKHERTADCVVAGFRWHKSGPVIGSLLLGLYDDKGTLHHVGAVGAPTAIPGPAPTTSSRRPCPRCSARCSARRAEPLGLLAAQLGGRRRVHPRPQLLADAPEVHGGVQPGEDGEQAQVDALDDHER